MFKSLNFLVFAVLMTFFIFCGEDNTSEGMNLDKIARDSIYTPTLKPVILHDTIERDLTKWEEFNRVRETIDLIGFVNSYANETSSKGKSIIANNTYQSLLYQLIALDENISKLNKKEPNKSFNTKAIKSRISLLRTHILKLRLDMEMGERFSNRDIIKGVDYVFESYNFLLEEIEREYSRKFDFSDVDLLIEEDEREKASREAYNKYQKKIKREEDSINAIKEKSRKESIATKQKQDSTLQAQDSMQVLKKKY